MVTRQRITRTLLILVPMVMTTSAALAHAKLVRSDPLPNSTVSPSKRITLTFNENISPTFSGFTVAMGDGMKVGVTAKLSDDGKTIVGTPTGPLMAGKYELSWHAASVADGHKTEGSFGFTVK